MNRVWLVVVGILVGGCPPRQVAAPRPIAVVKAPPPDVVTPPSGVAPAEPKLRLPRNFLPTGYTARLEVDPAKTGFVGSIAITGVIDQPSAVVWLHGQGLAIQHATATKESQEVAIKVTQRGEELLKLEPAQPLEPGVWTLMIDYTGRFDLISTAGAFKQVVGDAAYVYTQFEAIYARRVFPCLDEPDNKVPWKLALDVPAKLVAVANTPTVSEVAIAGGRKRVEFALSKPLPSYLVAFAVGPFEIVDAGKTKGGTPVRIITLAKRTADAAYAAKTSAKLIELTEKWFATPYPYEKLDMLAIPVTAGFSAMENAGLITFAETLILHDAKASKSALYDWVRVASHEIAHQWFGNLVTTAYWDDIWLNEGFANWLESKTSGAFEPSWHEEDTVLDMRNGALGSDSLVTARQIRQPIESNDDIFNAFDSITYDKGASVLSMFEAYVGPDVFQRGVRDYLAAHAWGNATSTDFATTIARTAGKDVIIAAFTTFLDQAGTPEITATLNCTAAPHVDLAQQRYVKPGSPPPPATNPWIVPVCVAYDRGGKRAEVCSLLDGSTGSIALDTKTCPRWVMPNVHGRGYFRNAYTPAQLAALRDEAWPQLSWTERRALAFDANSGALTGRLPLPLALSFVPKLLAGADRFTVPPALTVATALDNIVVPELRAKYEYWLRQSFGPGATKAGLTPTDFDTLDIEETRTELIGVAARTAHEPTLVAQAEKLADHWRDLPQSIRATVLDIAVDASLEVFARILRDAKTEPERDRREEMYSALASVRDVARQTQALALLLDPGLDIRETLWMLYRADRDETRANAQQFFTAHKSEILARLPKDSATFSLGSLSAIYTVTCRAASRDAIATMVRKEFAPLPGGARVVEQAIEDMDQCIAQRTALEPMVKAWLGGLRIPKPPNPEAKLQAAAQPPKSKANTKTTKSKTKTKTK